MYLATRLIRLEGPGRGIVEAAYSPRVVVEKLRVLASEIRVYAGGADLAAASPLRVTRYEYTLGEQESRAGEKVPLVLETREVDGERETVYSFEPVETLRHRWKANPVSGEIIEESPAAGNPDEHEPSPPPPATDLQTRATRVRKTDHGTGAALEDTRFTYDSATSLRPRRRAGSGAPTGRRPPAPTTAGGTGPARRRGAAAGTGRTG